MRFSVVIALLAGVCLFAADPSAPIAEKDVFVIEAEMQEFVGDVSRFRGAMEFRMGGIVITADEADYDDSTGELEARGDVHYRNLNDKENLHAARIFYNTRTELGTFYDVFGTVSAASQAGARIMTTDNPFYIDGEVVHKVRGKYIVSQGVVTNCESSNPWWTLHSPRTTIVPGESATVHRGVFRLKGAPIFYMPVFKKSLERLPRQSGFLTPSFGNSSRFGLMLGQSYYWAINRSYDATVDGTWFTDRGLALRSNFRGRPTQNSTIDADFFGVRDRGLKLDNGERLEQGGQSFTIRGTALFPGGFRGVADMHYLSSLEFRQAFTQTFDEAVFSQVRSIGFITKNFSTYSINASFLRDENFQTVTGNDSIIIRKLPSVEFNSHPHKLVDGPVPLWFSLDSSFDLVSRQQDDIKTRRFVQRGDFFPRVSTNFFWNGFHVTPTIGGRVTAYGQSFRDGRITGENTTRTSGEISLDLALPSLQRVFNGPKFLGDKIKHVIEPRVKYRYVGGIDEFNSLVLIDDRDILNNTNEVELSLTQRLFAKQAGSGETREIAALEIRQRRFLNSDFDGAVAPGVRNVLRSSIDLTPFAFLSEARSVSPTTFSLRVRPTWRSRFEWRTDYDSKRGRIVNSSLVADYQISDLLKVGVGHNAVRPPPQLAPPSNQLTTRVAYGDFNRRGWNFAVNSIYDFRQALFIYTASQATYNTDCCGFGFEVRRFAIGRARTENQFRVSLTIANVGSFGTLRPQERLF